MAKLVLRKGPARTGLLKKWKALNPQVAYGWNTLPEELQNKIVGFLPLDALQAFAKIRPLLAHRILQTRFTSRLTTHGLPVKRTVKMMKDTDTLIARSTSTAVVADKSIVNMDIDMYTGHSQIDPVMAFLCSNGYLVVHSTDEDWGSSEDSDSDISMVSLTSLTDTKSPMPTDAASYARNWISSIYTLYHLDKETKINVIQSTCGSSAAPILEFHSTVVMNWIAWDGVVCLYPQLTLDKKGTDPIYPVYGTHAHGIIGLGAIVPPYCTPKAIKAMQKYVDRGFTIYDSCTELDFHTPQDCYEERGRTIYMPRGCTLQSNALNPYCQRRVREVNDTFQTSMSFAPFGSVSKHSHSVRWRLSYLTNEAQEDLLLACQMGWVEVDGTRLDHYVSPAIMLANSLGIPSP
ncbi:hypothetical protein BKA70DRAFT_1235243 [Coprinopsis sp. MPI-PUGE-AT-0042]|nr:hypothetical protein BKA70DRAFT_1235243 [Coprinopsis sp. MPI-PUGE-AT-0042]